MHSPPVVNSNKNGNGISLSRGRNELVVANFTIVAPVVGSPNNIGRTRVGTARGVNTNAAANTARRIIDGAIVGQRVKG